MFKASRSIVATTSNSFVKRATMQKRSFFGLFANKNDEIVGDAEQQSGRRKEEIDLAAQGISAFNREPIIPQADVGTKENPILVSYKFNVVLFNVCVLYYYCRFY